MSHRTTEAGFIVESIGDDWWDLPALEQAACLYDLALYSDVLFAHMAIAFPANLQRAVPKRRAEFLAGRFCARRAQALLGVHGMNIGVGRQREPLWPDSVKGSISHSRQMAVSVASRDADILGVGVDMEEWLDRDSATQVQGNILTSGEQRLLSCPEMSAEQVVTLIFSAKESFYKAAFPLVDRFFDFDAVSLVELDISGRAFRFRLNQTLHPLLQEGDEWEGKFHVPDYEKLLRPTVATLVVLGRG